ncbi:Ribonuclease P protein subunit p40 [Thoreauomyces humboldtii]|nr:Ribonuclease P protein subunit p40 [Thoreauomyces humboldtii]
MALQRDARLDTGDVIAVLPSGILIMNLTKDTYQTLGLVGKKAFCGQRFEIRLDLAEPGFKNGSKGFDRVAWCFSHTLTRTFEFILASVDLQTGLARDIDFPPSAAYTRNVPSTSIDPLSDLIVPMIPPASFPPHVPSFDTDMDAEQWRSDAIDLFEWFGMVTCDVPRISAVQGTVDPFYSVYSCPEPNAIGTLTRVRGRGFLPPTEITSVLDKVGGDVREGRVPWAAVMVWGYRDAPIGWRDREHGWSTGGGENDSMILVLPGDQCVVFQAAGSGDAFSM